MIMKSKIIKIIVGLNLVVAFISTFATATVPSYYTSTGFELMWRATPLILFITITVISIGLFKLINSHQKMVIVIALLSFVIMVTYIVVNDFAYGKTLLFVLLVLNGLAFIWLLKVEN